MGIEAREGSAGAYKYKSVRHGGKVKKLYVGSMANPDVELLHRTQELQKAASAAASAAREAEFRQIANVEIYLGALGKLVAKWKSVYRAWWFARVDLPANQPNRTADGPQVIELIGRYLGMLPNQRTFRSWCRRAEGGDAAAVEQLESLLAATPDFVQQAVDLLAIAKQGFIEGIAADSQMTRGAVALKIDAKEKELGGRNCEGPLVQLLAGTTVVFWMDVTRCQAALSRSGISQKERKAWSDMADRASKRYVHAADALRRCREAVADGNPLL